MQDNFDSQTHLSLLERLGDTDLRHLAWSEFLDRYIEMIMTWCRYWGLQEADAEEVLQETMLSVYRGFKGFKRQGPGSFRAWLKTVARNNWICMAESRKRSLGKGLTDEPELNMDRILENRNARDHLLQLFDQWATQEILDLAMANVRRRVEPNSWQAFELLTFQFKKAEEVGRELQMSAQNVYLIVFRVRKMIAAEMALLDSEDVRIKNLS